MGQIANADETAIYLDMPPNYTLEKKGVKEIILKTTGCEKLRLTVMLAATADGRKLPPFLILKRKTVPKSESFPKDVIVRAQEKGWMTEQLMLEWLKQVWSRRPGAFLNQPSMLVLDAFKGHVTDSVKDQLRKMKTELVVIPGGMTSVLQPMDVSINLSINPVLLTAVAVFRNPNAIPLCLSIGLRLNVLLSWLLVLLPSMFFLDVLSSFSPMVSIP